MHFLDHKSPKFVANVLIDNMLARVKVLYSGLLGPKPLTEPI